MRPEPTAVDLSIVIPLYNEEKNVEPLCAELLSTLDRLPFESEVVLIDDGSTDGTFERAVRFARAHGRISVVRLQRNYGQTAALQAGFDHASGSRVVVMDGDLQNDPSDIPLLLAQLEQGYDMVTGWRFDRQDARWSRLLPSRLANLLLRLCTGVEIHDSGCALKAYRGDTVRSAQLYSDMHRFLPVFVATQGASYSEVKVNHRPRVSGQSKYGMSRVWSVLLDLLSLTMLARFTHIPSRWFLLMSLPFLGGAVVGIAMTLYSLARSTDSPTVFSAAATLCTFAFLHLFFFALLAELILWTGDFRSSPRGLSSSEPAS